MAYAIRNDGLGWRSIDSEGDCASDETYSDTEPSPLSKTAEELMQVEVADVKRALQAFIDAKAISLGFSGGNALMLYAGFTNAFQPIAQVFAEWEASVWVEADAYKQQVIAGTKPMLDGAAAVAIMPAYPSAS